MPLMPKNPKFRKPQRGKARGSATKGSALAFGDYGLQALEPGWISAAQIEAGRVAATHFLARTGKLWVRIFPHRAVTATPHETRMGTGKGEPAYYTAVVKAGSILYELFGVPEELARQTLARAAHKMPVRVRFVSRTRKK